MEQKVVLLDGNSILNRAYYALPSLTSKDGTPTGAVYGFTNMLERIIKELKPTHIVAVFDVKAPTFRKEMYAEYKAQRKPMPDDLVVQLPILKEILRSANFEILEKAGYEADDIIGTLAKTSQIPVYIITGDRDSLQLVDKNITVMLTSASTREFVPHTPENIVELYGLSAEQVVDLKSLMGDASDNIPGVPGVGDKTARGLLAEYKTLDGVYANIEKIKGALKDKLLNNRGLAELSYKLATIDVNVPIEYDVQNFTKFDLNTPLAVENYIKYSFKSFLRDLGADKENFKQKTVLSNITPTKQQFQYFEKPFDKKINRVKITTITGLETLVAGIKSAKVFAFTLSPEFTITYPNGNNDLTLFDLTPSDNFFDASLTYDELMTGLKDVFISSEIKKIVFDFKSIKHKITTNGYAINPPFDDVQLLAYVYNSLDNFKNHTELLEKYGFPERSEAVGLFCAYETISKFLKAENLTDVYGKIELPLVPILYDMETAGFAVDRVAMETLGGKYSAKLAKLSKEIYDVAGAEFNINSPKQLGQILFEKLGLPHAKKTKTGFSTDADTLELLESRHAIVPLIIEYRETMKLLSTYIFGMLPLIAADGKIHTSFKQAVTATGRLSSTEPNLQNIPIRKGDGKELRRIFTASDGQVLVVADYSQIELRLLAAFSKDPVLIDAYKNGLDIHAITASAVHDVPLSEVTSEMRRSAKAVNFGIIYGISDFGLASDIGVSVGEARRFIEKYFATYPKVKAYMDANVNFARREGKIVTFMGRVRRIFDINNTNYNVRGYAERIAMNMPLQGGASDIIKLAMIKVSACLKAENLSAKLIMQVHDELIIDCPIGEVDRVKVLLSKCMETAADLPVKLIAETGVGKNWLEAK